MPFVELAAVVLCSTCAGFYFGRSQDDAPMASPHMPPESWMTDSWADFAAWPITDDANFQ